MRRNRTLVLGALLLAVSGCFAPAETVTRMADGVTHEGRFIAPEAYALYARGALLEARRDPKGALDFYTAALALDPDAPEILACVARLNCELARSPTDDPANHAQGAIRRGLAIDRTNSSLLAASARCDARFGRKERALENARRAARADPDSMSMQLLVVELCEATGQLDVARTWLDALVVRTPESRIAWRYVAGFAERTHDQGRALRARRALANDPANALERALADALRERDREGARRAADALRLSPGELAARAALAGASELAREQAELVLAADPTDTNAWIALLAVDDLARDAAHWTKTLKAAPSDPATPPSPSARRIHAELLERVVGPDARRAWETAF